MKRSKVFLSVTCLCLLLNVMPAAAAVKLPAVFADNMVLQQKTQAPIWGWADPGEQVRIKASWQGSAGSTQADKHGKWLIRIATPKAGGPYTITISGHNEITLQNVLIGEVWVCSGQSNMRMMVKSSHNAEHAIAAADYPRIRLFSVKRAVADRPQTDCTGRWSQCSPKTIPGFSATAYYFGRRLHRKLGVPVGLIHTSVGGTPAEAWTRKEALEAEPDCAPILARFAKRVADYTRAKGEHEQKLKEWTQAVATAKARSTTVPSRPQPPKSPRGSKSPASLYNGMIAPLIPYRIRGVIWYQGESNCPRAYQYRKLFPAMIANWRNDWGQGRFPFYYVQIAPYRYGREPMAAELREAQLMALAIPNTGMAVTMDIADTRRIHPRNKQDVGKGVENVETVIRLFFDHIGGGLAAKGGKLTHFTIAGKDREFVEATAVIDNDTIVVSSEKVKDPVAVRFAWSNAAVPNLFNAEGLPASSFRTDDWPGVTANRK